MGLPSSEELSDTGTKIFVYKTKKYLQPLINKYEYVYHKQTKPLIEFYKSSVIDIDGSKEIQTVKNNILNKLK